MFAPHLSLPIPMCMPWMGMGGGGMGIPYPVPCNPVNPTPSELYWHEFQIYDVVSLGQLKAMESDIRSGLAEVAGTDYIAFTTPCTLIPTPNLPFDFYNRPIGQMKLAIGKLNKWSEFEKGIVLERMKKELKVGGVTGLKDWRMYPKSLPTQPHSSHSNSCSSSSSSLCSCSRTNTRTIARTGTKAGTKSRTGTGTGIGIGTEPTTTTTTTTNTTIIPCSNLSRITKTTLRNEDSSSYKVSRWLEKKR